VGATTLLVGTGYGRQTANQDGTKPDYLVDDLVEAAKLIAGILNGAGSATRPQVAAESERQQGNHWRQQIQEQLRESAATKYRIEETCTAAVLAAAEAIARSLAHGGKVMLGGNGGSAADCQHIAAELVGGMGNPSRPPLPALALTTDTSCLTAVANDYGFEDVFRRQVEVLGRRGDVLVAISTSGNSANLLRAVAAAKDRGMGTVGLLGRGGGALKGVVDVAVEVPSDNTQRIQEGHITVGHIICDLVERMLSLETEA